MTRSIKSPAHFRKLPEDARQYEKLPTRLQALRVKWLSMVVRSGSSPLQDG